MLLACLMASPFRKLQMDVVIFKLGGGETVELFFRSISLEGLSQILRKVPGLLRDI